MHMLWIAVCLLIPLFISFYFYRRKRMSLFNRIGIKGPEPNIFTGNLFSYFKRSNVEFHTSLLNEYGSIVGYYLGSKPIILVKHIGLLKEIQSGAQSKDFEDRPRLVPGGINPSPKRAKMLGNLPLDEWRKLRKILNKSFTISKLKQMTDLINESLTLFIDKLGQSQQEELNFYDLYQKLTLDIIGRTAFGVDSEVQTNQNDSFLLAVKQEFAKTAKNSCLVKISLCFPELFLIIQWIRRSIEYLKERFEWTSTSKLWNDCQITLDKRRHNQNNRKDLLQTMIDAGLPNDVIIAQSVLFFEAAFETLSSSLAFITHILLNNEEVEDRIATELLEYKKKCNKTQFDYEIVNELDLMESVIAETLRLYPPQTTFISRSNPTNDFYYTDRENGIQYLIPKGIQIQIALYQIQRDALNFDNPDQFEAQRFIDANPLRTSGKNAIKWQAFGEGSRHCIGKVYARLVLKIVVSTLLSEFKLIRTSNTSNMDELELEFKTATMTPRVGVFGSVTPRK